MCNEKDISEAAHGEPNETAKHAPCEYVHPVKKHYRCPFEAVGEFDGVRFCALHLPALSAPKKVPAVLLERIDRMIDSREITEIPEWAVPRLNLENKNLRNFEFFRVSSPKADMGWSVFDGSAFGFCDLTRARLKLASGKSSRFVMTRLTAADLTAVDLSNSNFRKCSLDNAKLTSAIFRLAEIVSCDLSAISAGKADFSSARILDVDFSHARLRKALFRHVKFVNVDFSSADLRGADFTGAEFENVTFAGALLGGAKGLEGKV